jgi:hypothetical protein
MLVADIRYEHAPILHRREIAWLPIIYAAALGLMTLVGVIFWTRPVRRVLFAAYFLAVGVGVLGELYHTDFHPFYVARDVIAVWYQPPHPADDEDDGPTPPPLAPLAFCGIGLMGMLACLERSQYVVAVPPPPDEVRL